MADIVDKELWDHYSELPNPAWYEYKNNKKSKNMSTRAQVRFASREEGQSFSSHPDAIHAQFYKHSDGYPEGLGVDIAESLLHNVKLTNWEVESLEALHGDLEYIYYVWQAKNKETNISIFECHPYSNQISECTFVGTPEKLINKFKAHKLNTTHDR